MFNENIKKQWIEYYSSQKQVNENGLYNIFKVSESLENKLNKDVSTFNLKEINKLYKDINAKSKERLASINSLLKNYTQWYLFNIDNQNDKGENNYNYLEFDDFKKFINKDILANKYVSNNTFISYVDTLKNPSDKLFLTLLYNAIKGDKLSEIINLNVNQINGNVLHLSTGRNIEVSQEIIDLIRLTNDTYIYVSFGEARNWEMIGDNVFKSLKSSRTESMSSIYHRFCMKMIVFQKQLNNPELTINRIYTSGMLNALYNKSKELKMGFEEFCNSEHARPILNRYEYKKPQNQIYSTFREYLEFIH